MSPGTLAAPASDSSNEISSRLRFGGDGPRPVRRAAGVRLPRLFAVLLAVFILTSRPAAAQQLDLCLEAERFVRDVIGMVSIAEPDTIDDWRTKAMVPGCRVTAAGASTRSSTEIARGFYEVLAESGWVRTPDPRDAPAEASLRYRRNGADCLFNFYDQSTSLNTEAELDVSDAVYLERGERLFNFLVLCTPAAPAAPRGAS